MRRLLRIRMLILLVAIALIPAATLPFAERLRTEWAQFWKPKRPVEETSPADSPLPIANRVTVQISNKPPYGQVWTASPLSEVAVPPARSVLRFGEAQELGEAAGAIGR